MSDWKEENNRLERHYLFNDFSEALAFIMRVGLEAEKAHHHPEIHNVYNKVRLRLSTHDAGDVVTEKDYALARAIDKLV